MQNYFVKNVLRNAGFETGSLSPWTLDAGTAVVTNVDKKAGTYSLKLTATAPTTTYVRQGIFPLQPGSRILVTLWAKHPGGTLQGWLGLVYYDSEGDQITAMDSLIIPVGAGWEEHKKVFTAPIGTALYAVELRANIPTGTADWYADSIHCPAITLPVLGEDQRPASSGNHYWQDQVGTAMTNAFATQPFGFLSQEILLSNDSSTNWIEFSFAGGIVDGRLLPGEVLSLGNQERIDIRLRGQAGGESYRLMVN